MGEINGSHGLDVGSTAALLPSPELQAKAEQKLEFIQEMIKNIERAVRSSHLPEEKRYLQQFVSPEDECFKTLVNLMLLPKYAGFVRLRCVVLRAIQMILKVAQSSINVAKQHGSNENIGMKVMKELVGDDMASKAIEELHLMVNKTEQATVACDAMLVLAELGPEAFSSQLVGTLMQLFAALPDRAPDLAEVALRAHAWGGTTRTELVQRACSDDGGRYMGEVLLQIINRADPVRRLRAVKILTGCFGVHGGDQLLYTNDKRVLVELLLREFADCSDRMEELVCYLECYQALVVQCEAARSHQCHEAIQFLDDLVEVAQLPAEVSQKCVDILAILRA